ncbi:M24 family metallopeptidase [Corynebacterium confusum]
MSENSSAFPSEVYRSRIAAAQQQARTNGVAALVISPGAEFAYFTGSWMSSHERFSALAIPAEGEAFLLAPATDGAELAAAPVAELNLAFHGWQDGTNAHALAADKLREAHGAAAEDGARLAVSGVMDAAHLLGLQAQFPSAQWVAADQVIGALFSRKDGEEIAQLRAAALAIDAVHARVPSLLQPGVTEQQVADQLEELILQEHDAVDFVIVGSGPNGANPHHTFSERVLSDGDPVVVDIGGTFGAGYHSDCTRTYVVGGDASRAPEDFQAAYEVLRQAHAAGMQQARRGATAGSVDDACRTVITDAGWGDYFSHRTGHGIGLSTHEEPFIAAGNDLELAESMTFSIEPGIYKEGEWGMRLEDIVTINGDGVAESLNEGERDLR